MEAVTDRAVQSAQVGDEVVLFDPRSRRCYRLNPPAAAVWQALEGAASEAEVVAAVAARFGVAPPVVAADVRALLAELAAQGLVAHELAAHVLVAPGYPQPAPAPELPANRAAGPGRRAPATRSALARCHDRLVDGLPRGHLLPTYQAFGFRFTVVCEDDAVRRHLEEVLAPLAGSRPPGRPGAGDAWTVSEPRAYLIRARPAPDRARPALDRCDPPDRRQWRLTLGGRVVGTSPHAWEIADLLFWHVVRTATDSDTRHTIVHAAGASWGGCGVLLPGPENAGKSTLVAGLVAAGFDYLGDEAVALAVGTPDLVPLPRSIGLDRGSWEVLAHLRPAEAVADYQVNRWHVPADRIRAGSVGGPCPARHVVIPCYRPGHDAVLEPIADAEAVMVLLEEAFHVADRPEALSEVVALTQGASCWRLTAGALDDAVALVRGLVEGTAPGAPGRALPGSCRGAGADG